MFFDLEEERLHDHLRGFVRRDPLVGHILHSPWTIQLGVDPTGKSRQNAAANRHYQQQLEAIQTATSGEDFQQALELITRPYRQEMFDVLRERMNDATYWQALAFVWTDAEEPKESPGSRFAKWFTSARPERERLMDESEPSEFQTLPEALTLYRGASASSEAGLAWSLDRDVAQWFAKRFPSPEPTTVFEHTIPKSYAIALFTRRQEGEIVVHPDYWRK